MEYATATGLSRLVEGQVSPDRIIQSLSGAEYTSKDLWLEVKVLILDDTIEEKPYTDENEVMCWHYDPSQGRAVQASICLTACTM